MVGFEGGKRGIDGIEPDVLTLGILDLQRSNMPVRVLSVLSEVFALLVSSFK